VDAPKKTVEAVLERYFQGQFQYHKHLVVTDHRLAGHLGFGPNGEFTVPVKGGQKVKGWYLRTLAKAVIVLNPEEFPDVEID